MTQLPFVFQPFFTLLITDANFRFDQFAVIGNLAFAHAMTLPSIGFSLAVSGMMIPPWFCALLPNVLQ